MKKNNVTEELIEIVNDRMEPIGVASRKEIHDLGHWHVTFHAWVVIREHEKTYLLFQKRHGSKDTHPNKLDVSAAGHYLHGEKVEDGIRELQEELGIPVTYEELVSLGIFKGIYENPNLVDREFNRVYLLETDYKLQQFTIQEDELSGLYLIELNLFQSLRKGNCIHIEGHGFEFNESGETEWRNARFEAEDFAAQPDGYYDFVIGKIQEKMRGA